MLQQYFCFHFNIKYQFFIPMENIRSITRPCLSLSSFAAHPLATSHTPTQTSQWLFARHPVLLHAFTSLHKLVSLCGECPSLICLWNLNKFSSPAQGSPFPSHPDNASGFFLRPVASLYFLRMPSMGTIVTCTVIFFIGPTYWPWKIIFKGITFIL